MKKILLSIFAVLFALAGAQAEEVTFDFTNPAGLTPSITPPATSSGTNINGAVFTSGVVSLTATDGGTPSRIWNSSGNCDFRVYKGATITINVSDGYVITDVSATGATLNANVDGTSGSVTINVTATLKIKTVTVTYTAAGEGGGEVSETPAAPTLPAGCNFDDEMTVEITNIAEGATAYYSLNNEANWVEGSSVTINETATVYAKVIKDGLSSTVVSATYTKNVVLEDGAIMIIFATATSDKSQAASVGNFVSDHIKEHNFETTLTCAATNNCYVGVSGLKMSSKGTNGSFTLSLGGLYSVKSIVVSAVVFGTDAASVSVNGAEAQMLSASLADYTFDVNSEISQIKVDMAKRGYIASVKVICEEGADTPEPVAPNAPTLPASTTFEGSLDVTITAEDGADIYYTLDGNDPTTSSSQYSEPITISGTTTVKAIAVNEIGQSEVAEATYTLVETITLNNSTVAELIEAYASGNNIANDATVVGYIVGCVDGSSISNAVFGSEVETASNILLADDPYETNIDNCIPIQLPSGDVRTALNLMDNSDNYQKKVILTGDVIEYFKAAGLKNTSAYEFVDELYHTLTVTDAGWATLYLGSTAKIPSVVEAYTLTAVNDGWVTLTQVTGVIPANTGVIVKADAGDYKFFMDETATADVTGNLLKGTIANEYITGAAYVLADGANGVGLYKAQLTDGQFLNNANKAYLPATAVANNSVAFYGFDWNGTTGVEKVEMRTENGEIFDLTGRKVNSIAAPGIYIVNGKKVLVK